MLDARHYFVAERLKDGTPVAVRAVRPDDAARLVTAFEALEPSSVYTRFFGYRGAPTARELAHLREVDFVREVMLVATVGEGAGEAIVGGARFTATAERAGEVAFTVEEDYQGRGLAGLLIRHLAAIARAHGFTEFEADVLAANRAMVAVFARTGWPMRQQREGTTVRVTLAIGTD